MDGKQIGLGQRIVDIKDLRKVVHGLMRALDGKTGLLLEASGSVDTNWNWRAIVFALGMRLDVLEITNGPGEELPISVRL